VQLSVLDRDLTAPPVSPADGDRHIVASGATGDWAGWDLNVALWTDGAWLRLPPRTGWQAWVEDEGGLVVFDGAAWISTGGGSPGDLQNLALLGIGTTADASNPFTARLNDALWTAREAAYGGSGDVRLKLNKEASGNTASVLFQTGWSGRAEFGLVGGDAFGLKVSADGASWLEAFRIDADGRFLSGVGAAVPAGGSSTFPAYQLHGTGTGPSALMGVRWSDGAFGAGFFLGKSRGAVAGGSGSPVVAGDTLGTLSFLADNGSLLSHAAQIALLSEGDWSSAGTRDASLVFRTRSANTLADRMMIAPTGTLRLPGIATTAAAANAVLDPGDGNRLLRSTSSERYKRDIEDLERSRAAAVLDLRPVWYRSTAPADRPDWSWYGLLAEEVAVVDPRLVHWGYQDQDYETVAAVDPETGEAVNTRRLKPDAVLVPDGVQYERLTVLLIDVVRRQEARIAVLEEYFVTKST